MSFFTSSPVTANASAAIFASLEDAKAGEKFQFVRFGYFCKDSKNADTYNRIVELKDSFPKK